MNDYGVFEHSFGILVAYYVRISSSQFEGLKMKLLKTLAVLFVVGSTLGASAETRTITGHGAAKNREGLVSRFEMRLGQVNSDPAAGRLAMSWTRGDVKVSIVCERPHSVGVREHEGKMAGLAVATVTKGTDVRHWEGTVYLTCVDLRDATHTTQPDRIRMRFIRNPWESPEGDFFFEGLVTDGDISVKKS